VVLFPEYRDYERGSQTANHHLQRKGAGFEYGFRLMLSTTIDAIRAILRMDPTVSTEQRMKIIFRLRRGEREPKAAPPREARLLRREVVAERLGCSMRTVDHLAAEGVLRKVTLPGRKRACGFLESDIETLLAVAASEEPVRPEAR
jgi:hypothetical protein